MNVCRHELGVQPPPRQFQHWFRRITSRLAHHSDRVDTINSDTSCRHSAIAIARPQAKQQTVLYSGIAIPSVYCTYFIFCLKLRVVRIKKNGNMQHCSERFVLHRTESNA